MNVQAKVAIHKREHPECYCPVNRCLWRTLVCDRVTRQMKAANNCVAGYCPRHKRAATVRHDALEAIRRAARTKSSTLITALRENGVL